MNPVSANIYDNFAASAARNADRVAIGFLKNKRRQSWTYQEFHERVKSFSRALHDMGLKKGDRIAILASNHPYWAVADLAIARLGLVLVPIHTTLTIEQIRKILVQSRSKVLILGGGVETKLEAILENLPKTVTDLIFFLKAKAGLKQKSHSMEKMMKEFSKSPDPPAVKIAPRDLATIIFTSGTTGEMKGVMLCHQGIVDNCYNGSEVVGSHANEIVLSVLPLSHAFERTAGLLSPLFIGGRIEYGNGIFELVNDLAIFRPTRINTVPRLLEKMREGIDENLKKKSGNLHRLFHFCMRSSQSRSQALAQGSRTSLTDSLIHILGSNLFYSKIRKKFGGRLHGFICGGAPLDPSVIDFFQAMGIQVLQGYGLTETSPIVCASPHDRNKIGSVGPPIKNMEVKIGANQEVLVRGTSLMLGYDDEAATRAAIDKDGWFHTGDQGELDADGFLTIKGRVKELIVTSYGKNIVPSWVEKNLEKSPLIMQSVVFGHGKAYLAALLILNREAVLQKLPAEKKNQPWEELCRDPLVREWIKADLQKVQKPLASYEQVKKFTVIPDEFSMNNDLLTPTLKLKRNKILARYEPEVNSMFI